MKPQIENKEKFNLFHNELVLTLNADDRKTIEKEKLFEILDKFNKKDYKKFINKFSRNNDMIQFEVPNKLTTCQQRLADCQYQLLIMERNEIRLKQKLIQIKERALKTEMEYCNALEEIYKEVGDNE
jgi:hypothetical protein